MCCCVELEVVVKFLHFPVRPVPPVASHFKGLRFLSSDISEFLLLLGAFPFNILIFHLFVGLNPFLDRFIIRHTFIQDILSRNCFFSWFSMASAWSEEETFACSVCLETLKEPATLPCGHSYCLACIQSHWDKKNNNSQYSCPQCRQVFQPRPSLAKSTVLVEAMEKLKANSLKHHSFAVPPSMPIYLEVQPDTGPQQANIYPQLATVDSRSCPQHNHPLDLFCRDDKECVCKECCQHGHKGHDVVKPQEEREERQVCIH